MSIDSSKFKGVKEYLLKGAIVLDVRTEAEFIEGHVDCALHIVLDELEDEIDHIKGLQKPIITCCRSGVRSEHAKVMLLDENIDVINGGPWQNVAQYV